MKFDTDLATDLIVRNYQASMAGHMVYHMLEKACRILGNVDERSIEKKEFESMSRPARIIYRGM